jgi:protein TonB
MLNFIRRNLRYPDIDAQGTVWLRVNVQPDGTITDAAIARGVQTALDAEALRIVRSFPRFEPGRVSGMPVCVSYNIPVKFKRE